MPEELLGQVEAERIDVPELLACYRLGYPSDKREQATLATLAWGFPLAR